VGYVNLFLKVFLPEKYFEIDYFLVLKNVRGLDETIKYKIRTIRGIRIEC
jgi:hypothetical protein